jgi:hypothetical protein
MYSINSEVEFVVCRVPISQLEPKIDELGNLKSNKGVNWNCMWKIIFPIHPGVMRMQTNRRNADGTFSFNVLHCGDCDVQFKVDGQLDKGVLILRIPAIIGTCSEECITSR